ncbi:MAG: hypothetical protein WAT51_10565 [Holophaga sp.]
MLRPRFLAPLACLFLVVGCESEDPRLPQKLLEDARALSNSGKTLEARTMLERIAQRYPDTPTGKQAQQDLFIIQVSLKQEMQEKQRLVRASMKRIMDALERYKSKHGEYPWTLQVLVPDYLDLVPETPWAHPFLYRPFVPIPIEELRDRRGSITQRFNTKYEAYHLVCLGTDLKPGGEELAQDILVVTGEFYKEATLPPIPMPQPVK